MSDRGSSIPAHHCKTCDFGSDSKKIFEQHYETSYHRDAVLARNNDKED